MTPSRQAGGGPLVVVITRLAVHEHDRIGGWVARFDQMALTAYGNTRDDAIENYKKLFNRFIHRHREIGQLEQRLNKSGVTWCWANQYKAEYEDTNDLMDNPHAANRREGCCRLPCPAVADDPIYLPAAA